MIVLARYGGAFGTSLGLHAALAAWLAWPAAVHRAAASERRVEVVLLPPQEDSAFAGLKPVDRGDARWKPSGAFERGAALAGSDLERISAHLPVLFPFVTPGLALDAFFAAPPAGSHLVFENPFIRSESARARASKRPFEKDATELQALVDHAWTRNNRWKAFAAIQKLIENHDANDPRLARLIALYRDQNALQPYADGQVRDLRLWAQLGLAADHVEFIAFIRMFARSHGSSRVTTELLLLLDTLAQANEDALATLVETDQPGDLEWTQRLHPQAYQLAKQIQREYGRELLTLGLTSRAAIERFYARGRLSLLMAVLQTTPNGYRANDVRFLMGTVLWNLGRAEDAVHVWRELAAPGADDSYAAAISQLRTALGPRAADTRNINYILRNQQGRWLAFSDDRLRRFGYRFDTF